MADDYLSIAETAALTGLKPAHLAQLRYRRQGPPFLKPTPKTVRYRRSDVLAWLDSSAVDIHARRSEPARRSA